MTTSTTLAPFPEPDVDALPSQRAAPAPPASARTAPAPRASDASLVEADAHASEPGPLGTLERLLRAPDAFLAESRGPAVVPLVRTLLATLVIAAGVFGAVVGAHRGGVQIAFAAIKVPLLLVSTLVLSVPAFLGIGRAFDVDLAPRGVIALTLGACARFALVLAGLAPLVWLLEGWLSYHGVALAITGACAVAGLAASALLLRGLADRGSLGVLAGVCMVAVYALVGAQASWMLRPFLVRPRTIQVPFLRPTEGDLFGSVRGTARSVTGDFDDESGRWLSPEKGRRAPSRAKATCNPETDRCD